MTDRLMQAIASEAFLLYVTRHDDRLCQNTCNCVKMAEKMFYKKVGPLCQISLACKLYRQLTSARISLTGFKYIPVDEWLNNSADDKRKIREANLWTFYQSTMSMDAF